MNSERGERLEYDLWKWRRLDARVATFGGVVLSLGVSGDTRICWEYRFKQHTERRRENSANITWKLQCRFYKTRVYYSVLHFCPNRLIFTYFYSNVG